MPAAKTIRPIATRSAQPPGEPFFGGLDAVIVDEPVEFAFDGSIAREHASAAWTWLTRDVAEDLLGHLTGDDKARLGALDAALPEILARARSAIAATATSSEAAHRVKSQLGGEDPWVRLPVVINALKCRHLLGKAQAFGRATNGMQDEAALAAALQAMPLNDQSIAALVMHAAVGQVAQPHRLMTAAIRITGASTEGALMRAGFGPLADAMLAHAQNQLHHMDQVGPFADVDLICRALDRYHRLARAVHGYVELSRNSRWTTILAAVTKSVSNRVEPHLRRVFADVNKALRKPRDGTDRLDSDLLLTALNGVYLLATVRDARDSLAVNALFEQTWAQVGQALEIQIQRLLDALRQEPEDRILSERLDAGIKMAELRFTPEYAELLRRSKETAQKR